MAGNRRNSPSKFDGNDDESVIPTDASWKARVDAWQNDLQTANAHLELERERVSTECFAFYKFRCTSGVADRNFNLFHSIFP